MSERKAELQGAGPPLSLDTFVRAYSPPSHGARSRAQRAGDRLEARHQHIDIRPPSLFIVLEMQAALSCGLRHLLGTYRIYATDALLAHQHNPAIAGLSVVEE